MEPSLIISLILCVLALASYIKSEFHDKAQERNEEAKYRADLAKKLADDRIAAEKRFTNLETKMTLLWGGIEKSMGALIHSPHTPDIDRLIERVWDNSISHDEIVKLDCMLDDELKKTRNGFSDNAWKAIILMYKMTLAARLASSAKTGEKETASK